MLTELEYISLSYLVMSIASLLFLLYLVSNNVIFSNVKTRYYIFTIVFTISIIICEGLDLIANKMGASFYIVSCIVNVVGFCLAPLIPIGMSFLYLKNIENKRLVIYIPAIICGLFTLSSPFTGLIFNIDKQNGYTRGPLFLVFLLTCAYGFAIMIIVNKKFSRAFKGVEKIYFTFLYLIIIIAIVVQLIFPDVHLIWQGVTISLIMYYIFLREYRFKYDALTGALNRQAFDHKMDDLNRCDKAVIIMCDLDNLKITNDTYGHLVGDIYIRNAAKVMRDCFKNLGDVYRIGGDEFCILSTTSSLKSAQYAINNMIERIEKLSISYDMQIGVSYGMELYDRSKNKDIFAAFAAADKKMYKYKAELK